MAAKQKLIVDLYPEDIEAMENAMRAFGIATRTGFIKKLIRLAKSFADSESIILVGKNGNQKEVVFI